MRRKGGNSQLPLNLPMPSTAGAKAAEGLLDAVSPLDAEVISFVEKKAVKDKAEANKHFLSLLKLVRHFE